MICLKNRTFAVSQTSRTRKTKARKELWFAWKIVLLQYHKHPNIHLINSIWGCDLLEKSYFCSITNIHNTLLFSQSNVVICLKNRTFAVSQTSISLTCTHGDRLWFAWKIVLLQYHKHLVYLLILTRLCCDLLEKSYFCSITNILPNNDDWQYIVVICLKNRTFAVSQTS